MYINNLSKSQVFVAHSFWAVCQNVSRNFVELCMETPYWCTALLHQYGHRKSTKTSGVHFFYKSYFLFTWELAYVCINIRSKTWNGYTAENQKERLFFREIIMVSRTVKTWKFKLLYFEKKHATGLETCTKIFFVYLQRGVNKNW